MKRALIQGTRICDIVAVGAEFAVHSDLKWVDVADDTVSGEDTYVDGSVVKYVNPTPDAKDVWEREFVPGAWDMLRIVEDLYEVLTDEQKAAMPAAAVTKLEARAAKRAEGKASGHI